MTQLRQFGVKTKSGRRPSYVSYPRTPHDRNMEGPIHVMGTPAQALKLKPLPSLVSASFFMTYVVKCGFPREREGTAPASIREPMLMNIFRQCSILHRRSRVRLQRTRTGGRTRMRLRGSTSLQNRRSWSSLADAKRLGSGDSIGKVHELA